MHQQSAGAAPTTRSDADARGESPGGLRPPLAWGALAKRISGRTTDLIAIALIAIAALTVGRQLSGWWNTDSEENANPLAGLPSSQPDWAGGSVLLELGDSPVAIRREAFTGDGDQAVERLVAICLADVKSAAPPAHPAEPPERKMLDHLKTLPPVVRMADGSRVHFVPVPVPMTVGTRDFTPATVPSAARGGDNEGSDTGRRVVAWGLAMRQGERSWTLFSFRSGPPVADAGEAVAIELPPGSRRTLALRGSAGERLIGFEGNGSAAEWRRHFDALAARRGWRAAGDWRVAAESRTRGFEVRTESKSDSTRKIRSRIDVQFGPDDRGGHSGLIAVTPLPEE
ncbi:MAG: hypothetical protein WD066_05095 [Planctomycetaceae bacterium]